MQVILKYESEKTYNEVYDMFITELKDAISANAYNKAKLEAIRQELLDCIAKVSIYQYKIVEKQNQDKLNSFYAKKDVVLTSQ